MWRGIKPHLCRIGASPLIGWKFAPSTSRLKSLDLHATTDDRQVGKIA